MTRTAMMTKTAEMGENSDGAEPYCIGCQQPLADAGGPWSRGIADFHQRQQSRPPRGSCRAGALLPDLDATHSTIKYLRLGGHFQPFRLPVRVLSHQLGHRGPLHSLAGIALLWLGWQPTLALALGMLSHLLGDASTKSGVPLLYPKPGRWHLLPKDLRLTTGSPEEEAVFGVMLLPLLLLLFELLRQG